MTASTEARRHYFVPQPSPYPILVSISLMLVFSGLALYVNGVVAGQWVAVAGALPLVYAVTAWFATVIGENRAGFYHGWEDRSFRLGMIWFIISEVVLFSTFFGALFYERVIAVPWIASLDPRFAPWHHFAGGWPTSGPTGTAFSVISPWGIPLINTLLLLSSGATVTWAHWGLLAEKRGQLKFGLFLTIVLGAIFISLQAHEFYHAYTELGLTLGSGVYGATFFALTGLHGLHVTLGVLMLSVMLLRAVQGDFKRNDHFAFTAVSWYWHFVDVVWMCLFVFVYWL